MNFDPLNSSITTLVELFAHRGSSGNTGVHFINDTHQEEFVSYGQLYRDALQLLHYFQLQGIRPGDEIVFQLDDNKRFLLAFWACILGGFRAVPVAVARHQENYNKLRKIIGYLHKPYLLTTSELIALTKNEKTGLQALFSDMTYDAIICMDQVHLSSGVGRQHAAQPGDIAFIQFSSGSTGQPKGVALTHQNILANVRSSLKASAVLEQQTFLSWMPLTHDMGLIGFHINPAALGTNQWIMPPELFVRHPMLWLQKLHEHRINITASPNSGIRHLLQKFQQKKMDLSCVRIISNGAEPISASLCRRFLETLRPCGLQPQTMYPVYGLAEATLAVSFPVPGKVFSSIHIRPDSLKLFEKITLADDASHAIEVVSVGNCISCCNVQVVNEQGNVLEEGHTGYIFLKGENITAGYYNNAAAAQAAVSNGWLNTQDTGFMWKGELYITGRTKELIFHHGRNIYPQDIEAVTTSAEENLEAVACGIQNDDEKTDEIIVFVKYRKDPGSFSELANKLKRRVASKMGVEVDHVIPVKKIPLTSSGKIKRFELAANYRQGMYDEVIRTMNWQHNPSRAEQWMVEWLSKRLNIEPHAVNAYVSFADLGVTSLMAVEFAQDLEAAFNMRLQPAIAWKYPNVKTLAAYVAGQLNNGSPATINNTQQEADLIAVVGMACRFPQANDTAAFWELLHQGVDCIGKVPASRWSHSMQQSIEQRADRETIEYGGYLSQVDAFDPVFFGISPAEAVHMDPQQRLLMEVSWEALEDAGIPMHEVSGREAGVFVGISSNDYGRLASQQLHPYAGTGNAFSIAANRLSYFFNFQGPSVAIDTACSSSLVAVHQACQSLRSGESSICLAGGINLLLSPALGMVFSENRMLSKDGRCKTFDAGADGYVRGEGCGIVVLKKLKDAEKDGDRILAVIRGSAVNQDGHSNGLTAPNPQAQKAVIQKAIRAAGVQPADISYVEAHGTGTPLGDPIELNTLIEVLKEGRSNPCCVGSVKTNIGHLEAAAGIAGLIKTILSLQHQQIPPHLHFKSMNAHILQSSSIQVPQQPVAWSADKKRMAGVSSFGFGGTNAHVVVEEAPAKKVEHNGVSWPVHLFALSATTSAALHQLAERNAKELLRTGNSLQDICYTSLVGRTHFSYRLAILARSNEDLAERLSDFLHDRDHVQLFKGRSGQVVHEDIYHPSLNNGTSDHQAILQSLAQSFVEGAPLDWKKIYPHHLFRKVSLPSYPFKRERYWLEELVMPVSIPVSNEKTAHPLLGAALNLAPGKEMRFANTTYHWPGYLNHHIVYEKLILPASAYIEMALAAGKKKYAAGNLCIENIAFEKAMVLQAGNKQPVQFVLAEENNSTGFHVYTEQHASWQLHCSGHLLKYESKPNVQADLHEIKNNYSEEVSPDALYNSLAAAGITYGPDFRAMQQIFKGNRKALAKIALPSMLIPHADAYCVHPVLLDACFQAIAAIVVDEDNEAWMPVSIEKLIYLNDIQTSAWAHIQLRDEKNGDAICHADLWIYDEQGKLCIEVQSLIIKKVSSAQLLQPAADDVANWLYNVAWRPMPQLHKEVSALRDQMEPAQYAPLFNALDKASVHFIVRALSALGCSFHQGSVIRPALFEALKLKHARLLNSMLQVLEEEGLIEMNAGQWKVIRAIEAIEPAHLVEQLAERFPAAKEELDLFRRCASQLAAVLKGETDALGLLFPGGDISGLAAFYSRSPVAVYTNTLAAKAVASFLHQLPAARRVNILEIGAGTGATTAAILPHLEGHKVDYCFTDISPLFLQKAQEKFTSYPFISYKTLDIEAGPSVSGCEAGEYDIIIASNVLHATKDVAQSLKHIHSLLSNNGLLVLTEITARQKWLDLVFGLTDGWWRFEDIGLRPSHPLLTFHQWKNILERAGFISIDDLAAGSSAIGQSVLISHKATSKEHWLLLADDKGLASDLLQLLHSKQIDCTVVPLSGGYKQILHDLSSKNIAVKLIDMRALSTPAVTDAMQLAALKLCTDCLDVLRELVSVKACTLYIVTRGSQYINNAMNIEGLVQSCLASMQKVITLEHPELQCRLIDMDATAYGHEANDLLFELMHHHQPGITAIRKSGAFSPRLIKAQAPPAPQALRKGVYLITGGSGGLAIAAAKKLAEKGVGHLVLVSRNILRYNAALEELKNAGVEVTLAEADVTVKEDLMRVLDDIRQTGIPLRGVIHAAGILDDGILLHQHADQFGAVLKPKVMGAWNLHQLTENIPLDHFILFSSATTLFGSPGQSSHCAANAFLDALAFYRHAKGLPALSMNWGLWSQTGIVAGDKAERFAEKFNWIKSIPTTAGADLFYELMHADAPQVAIMPILWKALSPAALPLGLQNFISECIPNEHSQVTKPEAVTQSVQQVSSGSVHEYILTTIAEIIGIPVAEIDVHSPLLNMGMDSLLSIDLKNSIKKDWNIDIDIARLMEGISAHELTQEVEKQLHGNGHAHPKELKEPLSTTAQPSTFTSPLSYGQQALWFLHQQVKENQAYHIAFACRILSRPDIAALKRSFQQLINRHSIFRTTYSVKDEAPMQVVHNYQELYFEEVDAAGWSEEMMQHNVKKAYDRQLNLQDGPVCRVHLFTKDLNDHVLLFVVHHIACDAWSLSIINQEFHQLYKSETSGLQVELPLLEMQYTDYVHEHTQMLASEKGEVLWNYWKTQFEQPLTPLNLPVNKKVAEPGTFQGASCNIILDENITSRLRNFSKEESVTLFVTVFTAFQVLLHRYTAQEDIITGTPAAGRNAPGYEKLAGYFVNPVPIRSYITGNASFKELLKQVNRKVTEAIVHQDLSFPLLVQKLKIAREAGSSPVFQVFFQLQRYHQLEEVKDLLMPGTQQARLQLGDLLLEYFELPQMEGQFDLSLSLMESHTHIAGAFKYNKDVFDADTVSRMAEHFSILLQGLLETPHLPVEALPLITAAEKHRILHEWNDTSSAYLQHATIPDLFEAQVKRTPLQTALIFRERSLNYDELNRKANQLAHLLLTSGISNSALVGVCMERSFEMITALLAILKAGAAYIPLDPALPQQRIHYMLEDAGAKFVITRASLKNRFVRELHCIVIDEDLESIAAQPCTDPVRDKKENALAYVIYTSGSSGLPKGVKGLHKGAVNRFCWMWNKYPFGENEICCQRVSYSFVGSVWEIFGPLLHGIPSLLIQEEVVMDADKLIDLLSHHHVTRIVMVPSLLKIILETANIGQKLSSLKYCSCSGEVLAPEIAAAFYAQLPQRTLLNLYGPTECSSDVTCYEVPANIDRQLIIGRPIANTAVYIVNQHLQLLPPGIPGELCVAGEGVAAGYLNRPELTAEKFISNPFDQQRPILYRSGDLARYLPDGRVEFLGRIDQQVKIRGFRIEPGEIEATLRQYDGIKEAVIAIKKDRQQQDQLVAYIVTEHKTPVPDAHLRSFLKSRLPGHMIPAAFIRLVSIPLTPNGKINRLALPAPEHFPGNLTREITAPRNSMDELLLAVYKEVLGANAIGIHDNFFEAGGHSLLAMKLVSRLRTALETDVPVTAIFNCPTVATLSDRLHQQLVTSPATTIHPVKDRLQLPLSFAHQRLWFLDKLLPGNPLYNMCVALRFTGNLTPGALEWSLNEIIKRHEILRTCFPKHTNEPHQHIKEEWSIHLEITELQLLPEHEQLQAVKDQVKQQSQLVFNIEEGPLLAVHGLKLGNEDHIVLFTIHHIICDQWSMGIFIRELVILYDAYCNGTQQPLPELPVQFADYAYWQRQWITAEKMEQQLLYWKEHLLNAPALDLPLNYKRPQLPSYEGRAIYFEADSVLTKKLELLGQGAGATLYMTLLSAFGVLLSKYASQQDIVLGSSTANRNFNETTPLIGFFANTLVLRIDLNGDPAFTEVLKRVRESVLTAFDHQDVPFEKIVEELNPQRSAGSNPLFQVFFVLQNAPLQDLQLPGLTTELLEFEEVNTKFDLTLSVTQTTAGLRGRFEYNTSVLDATTIRAMSRRFVRLLESIVHLADISLSGISLNEVPVLPAISMQGSALGALSYHQERLWFIDKFETGQVYPSHPSYHNIPILLQLNEKLDPAVLQQSLNMIMERHPVLRTIIVEKNGMLCTDVRQDAVLRLTTKEFVANGSLISLALVEAEHAVSLDTTLINASLWNIKDEGSLLMIVAHHIIADRHSMQLIAKELLEDYEARIKGNQRTWPAPAISYTDYANWQLGFSKEVLEQLLFYWKTKLKAPLQALELPLDHPRAAIHIFKPGRHQFKISSALREQLQLFLAQHEIDTSPANAPFVVLLTCFKAVLHIYSRQEEIVVGTSAACRHRHEIKNIAGPVANLLVLRSRLTQHTSFKDLLLQVSKTVADAYAYQDMPFDKLVLELAPDKDMSRTALFDVLFTFEKNAGNIQAGTLKANIIETNTGYGKYDLNFLLQDTGNELLASVVYNALLFDAPIISQFFSHFESMLGALLKDTGKKISDVCILSEQEVAQQLTGWNKMQATYPGNATIHAVFETQARRTPGNTAVLCEGFSLTYAELDKASNQLAHHLVQQGVRPGTLVAVCLERSANLPVALLGILKAGGAYLPLDAAYPAERLCFMLQDAAISYLVISSTILQSHAGPCFADIVNVVCIDEEAECIINQPAYSPAVDCSPSNLCYCLYTSGSTGKPKGVLIEHKQVISLLMNDGLPFQFSGKDTWTLFHSYCFDFSVWEMYGALLFGGRLVIVPATVARDPLAFLHLLQQQKVSVLNQTPGAFYNLLQEAMQEQALLPHLRYVIFGGEALDTTRLKPFIASYPHVKCINMYGITETTVHVTYKEITEADTTYSTGNIGKPLPTTTTYIFDESMHLLPPGVTGEIYVGGAGVARGYLNRPGLQSQKFINNPYNKTEKLYRSGDLAKFLPNGEMIYMGRMDEQVQVRGFRVEPAEIKSCLLLHQAIRDAAVVARRETNNITELTAYIVASSPITTAQLRDYLAERLPFYMVPSAFVQISKLPLTANGKLDTAALPLPGEAQGNTGNEFIAPRSSLEEMIAVIWREVLGKESIGVFDNFFEAGGHSLLAAQIVSRIRERLHIELPLRVLFECPSIAQLALWIENEKKNLISSLAIIPKLTDRSALPLAFSQKRLWLLHQMNFAVNAYHIATAVSIRGPLNIDWLKRSVNEIVARHESLRTTFSTVNGSPVQVIHQDVAIDIHCTDVQEQDVQPFDLEKGPLLRCMLLRKNKHEHIFLLSMHHIISDQWSIGIFIKELSALYEGFSKDQPVILPALPIQFSDFSAWQNEQLKSETMRRHLEYWRTNLAGSPAMCGFPADKPRPSVQTYKGCTEKWMIDEALSSNIRQLSQEAGVSLYVSLLSAFLTLLSRYSGQDDVVVGTPSAARSNTQVERLIGNFMNTLVLRVDCSDDLSFSQMLARVQQTCLDALEHQDLPFEKLVEELQPERAMSYNPVFQVMFILQNAPAEKPAISSLEVSLLELEKQVSRFDLTLSIEETANGLCACWEYNTDLFHATTIRRLAMHFENILHAVVNDPHQLIKHIDYLSATEKQQFLCEWNDTHARFDAPACIHQLIQQQVRTTPLSTAVAFNENCLSYHELNTQANQLAHYLHASGLQTGMLAGIYLERSTEMLVCLLAVLKAGAAYVPLDPAYPPARIAFILKDASVSYVLTMQQHLPDLAVCDANIICVDSEQALIAEQPAIDMDSNNDGNAIAYVIYTSGSTGVPKGVCIEHGSVVNILLHMKKELALKQDDVLLAVTSFSFDIAALELFLPLTAGACVVIAGRTEAHDGVKLAQIIKARSVTLMQATPSTWQLLTGEGWEGSKQMRALCGGEALPASLAQQLLPRVHTLWNVYGPTETTIWSLMYKMISADKIYLGRPISNTQLFLLDASMQPVAIGVAADLYIAGAGLARGYHNRPQLTAEKFIEYDPGDGTGRRLYKTGDRARYAEDGNLEFLGRADNQVKLRGYRIEPGEIESVLHQHPAVKGVIVLMKENAAGEKKLIAYVVLKPGARASANELMQFLSVRIPAYMLPVVALVEAFPLLPNGKTDTASLTKLNLENEASLNEYVAPRNATEQLLAQIWSQVLNLEQVSIHDNFFQAGGASLQVIQVVNKAKEHGMELTAELLFRYQTIALLAEQLPKPAITHAQMVIESLGVYLPEKTVSTKEIVDGCRHQLDFPLERMTGIRTRQVAAGNEFSIDLAIKAVEKCLSASKYHANDIDLVICCNISRYNSQGVVSNEPSTSARLKKHFGLANAIIFDVANACAGTFTALHIADAFLKQGCIRSAMIVSGERITHLMQTAQYEVNSYLDDRIACLTLGDSGVAMIVERSQDKTTGFHALELASLGAYSSYCIGKPSDESDGIIMHTQAMKFAAISIDRAASHAIRLLQQKGWKPETIQHLVLHQTSATTLTNSINKINKFYNKPVCTPDNTINNLAHRGNTATNSHFVALMDNINNNRIQEGDNIVFGISGSGITVGTALYTMDDLPARIRQNGHAQKRRIETTPHLHQWGFTGIKISSIGICPGNKNCGDTVQLLKHAATDCLTAADYEKHNVNTVLFTGVYRTDFIGEPAIATMLAGELDMNASAGSRDDTSTLAFDIYNGSLATLNACHIMTGMIRAGKAINGMIVAAEIENNHRHFPGELIGLQEAASAMLLEKSDQPEGFGNFYFKYFTDHAGAIVSNIARKNGKAFLDFHQHAAIENIYIDCICETVTAFLEVEGIDLSKIARIFPPQVSSSFIKDLSSRLGVETGKCIDVSCTKDLYTSSMAFSLRHALENKLVSKGDIGLMISVGSGVQVGVCLYLF